MLTDQTDGRVSQALSKYDFYFMPVFNVDGYKHTFTGRQARFWRKTRKPYSWYQFQCKGADPNRNWDSHWDEGLICIFFIFSRCLSILYFRKSKTAIVPIF